MRLLQRGNHWVLLVDKAHRPVQRDLFANLYSHLQSSRPLSKKLPRARPNLLYWLPHPRKSIHHRHSSRLALVPLSGSYRLMIHRFNLLQDRVCHILNLMDLRSFPLHGNCSMLLYHLLQKLDFRSRYSPPIPSLPDSQLKSCRLQDTTKVSIPQPVPYLPGRVTELSTRVSYRSVKAVPSRRQN